MRYRSLTFRPRRHVAWMLAPVALLAAAVSCDRQAPAGVDDATPQARFAKPPADPVEVTTFDPKEGDQGLTFPMTVSGNGFGNRPKVVFVLDGEDVSTIATTTTSVNEAGTELIADVSIGTEAVVSENYKIAVEARRSRGVGTESFKVKVPPGQMGYTQIIVEYPPRDEPSGYAYMIYGDGFDDQSGSMTADGSSVYTAGVCGVQGQLYDREGYSYDAVSSPGGSWSKKLGCDKRKLFFDYSLPGDGGSGLGVEQTEGPWSLGFMNIGHSGGDLSTTGIADDSHFDLGNGLPTDWVEFEAGFITDRCNDHLIFDPTYDYDTVDPSVSRVEVRRVVNPYDATKRMWEVQALPPNDLAYCQQPGRGKHLGEPRYFNMPFRLFIREK